jgi:predicted O-linked N-acetylglucosamine transferase (SPINDLY family)
MGILKHVPGSVLWLLGDEPNLQKNLRREAKQLGIPAERLIFAPKMDLNKHLARLVHADLFLDTFPYTAHTTASDALRAGVPVITRIGDSFPSRVAASLLATVELHELITTSPMTYAKLAIALATDPIRLNNIKSQLAPQRLKTTLFNPAKFASDLEVVFTQLIGRKPGASSN